MRSVASQAHACTRLSICAAMCACVVTTPFGLLVVPLNALLQHRGHVLMSAGHSIAVQNFNENLNVLTMLGIYALLLKFELHINSIILLFGAFVAITMLLVRQRYLRNAREHDLRALILDHGKH